MPNNRAPGREHDGGTHKAGLSANISVYVGNLRAHVQEREREMKERENEERTRQREDARGKREGGGGERRGKGESPTAIVPRFSQKGSPTFQFPPFSFLL